MYFAKDKFSTGELEESSQGTQKHKLFIEIIHLSEENERQHFVNLSFRLLRHCNLATRLQNWQRHKPYTIHFESMAHSIHHLQYILDLSCLSNSCTFHYHTGTAIMAHMICAWPCALNYFLVSLSHWINSLKSVLILICTVSNAQLPRCVCFSLFSFDDMSCSIVGNTSLTKEHSLFY